MLSPGPRKLYLAAGLNKVSIERREGEKKEGSGAGVETNFTWFIGIAGAVFSCL
jgi:hypothetical protein